MRHSLATFAARFKTVGIAILVSTLFLLSNSVFAASDHKIQCAPHTPVTKNMIMASLSDGFTPVERRATTENSPEQQTVAPRSEWIRVAPLVTKRCCGGYQCDQRTGECVCKQWC
jgi:hypothetical protein